MLSTTISLSEQMADMPDDACRLIATWTMAHLDREGRVTGSARRLKALVVPLLDLSVADVERAIAALCAGADPLATRYQDGDGQEVLEFRKFKMHQFNAHLDREAPSRYGAPGEAPERREAESVVYFVQAGEDGPIKIGVSLDVTKRIAELQGGAAAPLRVLCTVPGTRRDEAALHREFAALRVEGEWFKADPLLLARIEALLSGRVRTSPDVSAHARARPRVSLPFPSLDLSSDPDPTTARAIPVPPSRVPDATPPPPAAPPAAGWRESRPDVVEALLRLLPAMGEDATGYHSVWQDAYPHLDLVAEAKRCRAKYGPSVRVEASTFASWLKIADNERRAGGIGAKRGPRAKGTPEEIAAAVARCRDFDEADLEPEKEATT